MNLEPSVHHCGEPAVLCSFSDLSLSMIHHYGEPAAQTRTRLVYFIGQEIGPALVQSSQLHLKSKSKQDSD